MCLAGPGPARSQAAGRRTILKKIIISRMIYSFLILPSRSSAARGRLDGGRTLAQPADARNKKWDVIVIRIKY
jgi:hypothetical protein